MKAGGTATTEAPASAETDEQTKIVELLTLVCAREQEQPDQTAALAAPLLWRRPLDRLRHGHCFGLLVGLNALGERTSDPGKLPAEVLAAVGGATQSAAEVAHVVCDAALTAHGDVYTQPNASASVRAYMDKQVDGGAK